MMALPSCHSGYRCLHRRPNDAPAQRLEEEQKCGPVKQPLSNPQGGARFRRRQSYQNVSRETFLSDLGPKPYRAEDSGPFFDHVRSINFLVQFQEGGGGAPMAQPVAGRQLRCKVRSNQAAVTEGIFLHRTYAPRKPLKIKGPNPFRGALLYWRRIDHIVEKHLNEINQRVREFSLKIS
jgi:hypothetical protein